MVRMRSRGDTVKLIAEVRRLAVTKLTRNEIAAKLGVSKGTIQGLAHRNKIDICHEAGYGFSSETAREAQQKSLLVREAKPKVWKTPLRKSPSPRRTTQEGRERPDVAFRNKQAISRPAPPRLPSLGLSEARSKEFSELRSGFDCHWPFDDGKFCGQPGYPYCECHRLKSQGLGTRSERNAHL